MYRGKDCVKKFIACILDEYEYCRRVCRDHFNKSLIMSAEEEEMFQNACSCWICGKLFDLIDEKCVIIVILVVNLEELLILVVMIILKLVKKFLLCFTI